MDYILFHNPRCGKSRTALRILNEHEIQPEIIEYLKDTPSVDELTILLMKLNKKPEEIVRKKEPLFLEKFKGLKFNSKEWVNILAENPILIERPILVRNNRAIIARDPEDLEEFIKKKN